MLDCSNLIISDDKNSLCCLFFFCPDVTDTQIWYCLPSQYTIGYHQGLFFFFTSDVRFKLFTAVETLLQIELCKFSEEQVTIRAFHRQRTICRHN